MEWSEILDDDVYARLARSSAARGIGLNAVANEAIRVGLDLLETRAPEREPFRTKAVDLGPPLFNDVKESIRQMDEEYDRKKLGAEWFDAKG